MNQCFAIKEGILASMAGHQKCNAKEIYLLQTILEAFQFLEMYHFVKIVLAQYNTNILSNYGG